MRLLLGMLTLITVLAVTPGYAENSSTPEPNCPSDPRADDVPELLFTFESFDEQAFATDMAALRQRLPEWIEKKNARLRNTNRADDNSKIFDGELWMAYTNTLNAVEGYILKLEYLAANDADRAEKEQAFCAFIRNNIIID